MERHSMNTVWVTLCPRSGPGQAHRGDTDPPSVDVPIQEVMAWVTDGQLRFNGVFYR